MLKPLAILLCLATVSGGLVTFAGGAALVSSSTALPDVTAAHRANVDERSRGAHLSTSGPPSRGRGGHRGGGSATLAVYHPPPPTSEAHNITQAKQPEPTKGKVRPATRLCCESTSQRRPFGLRCQCDERSSTLQPGATTEEAGSIMHFEVGYINYFNSSNVRSGAKWYVLQTRRMLQSIASLRLSGYASLVHVVLGGERVAGWENAHACDPKVVVHRAASSAFPRPAWSSPFHRASFEKVWILHLSAQLEKPLLFLDNDVVVFRPLDKLRHAMPPAYVVKPREGINSGVMLLRETHETLARRLDAYSIVKGGGDRGDQRLVNVYHQAREFFELPAAYNIYTSDVDTAVPRWWDQIVLWHKPTEKGHLTGEARAYVNSHLKRVEAEAAVRRLCNATSPSAESELRLTRVKIH